MADKLLGDSYEIGRNAATEIRTTARQVPYIEARGLLCHELLYLLGGHIQFARTSWRQFLIKLLEPLFPLSPICRWYPPENYILEWIGSSGPCDTKVYRLITAGHPKAVFFVDYKPDRPLVRHIRPFFNAPILDLGKFLRPPSENSIDSRDIERELRGGLEQRFTPLPLTPGATNRVSEISRELHRGLWEGFSGPPNSD
jgi:hypothetical protein